MMYNMRPLPTVSKVEKELRRGPWTHEEDILLTHYIAREGEGRWKLLAKSAGLKRTGKSCRLRWLNYLKPDVKRGNLTRQEQLLILELHSKWGNKWSKIAQELPGRTDNEIKNYWRTKVQKQARQMKIETNSKEFIDVVRCCYVPRLLQQLEQQVLEQSPSCFTSSSSSSSLTTLHNPQTHQETASPPFNVSATTHCIPQTTLTHFCDSDLGTENSLTSSSVVSTESTTNTKQNQPGNFLQYPTRDATILPDTSKAAVDYNSVASDCYYVDYGGHDMDGVPNNLAYMSYQTSEFESASSYYEFLVAEDNWVLSDNGVAETLWNNMDDIWQLRE